jgi:hypothetical protein
MEKDIGVGTYEIWKVHSGIEITNQNKLGQEYQL